MNDPIIEALNNLHKDNKIILQQVQIEKLMRVGDKLSRALFNVGYDDYKLIINEWEDAKPKQK
jgi:hypothetical protein